MPKSPPKLHTPYRDTPIPQTPLPANTPPQSPVNPIAPPPQSNIKTEKSKIPNDPMIQSPDDSIPPSPITNYDLPIPTPPTFPLFPPGHLTLLLGLPGSGKSLLALYLAARLSHYSLLPPHPFLSTPLPTEFDANELHYHELLPCSSYIFAREDHQSTIDRRLSVAAASVNPQQPAADTRFIYFLDGSLVLPPGHRNHRLPLAEIRSSLVNELCSHLDYNPRLVVIDPLPAFLDHTDASNNPALIRAALDPLLEIAFRSGFSILGISHLTKANPRRSHVPLELVARSHAYTALARSILLLTQDPLNPRRRILTPLKNNLAHIPGNYAFTIHQHPDPLGPDLLPIPYIHWENEVISLDNSTQTSAPNFQNSPEPDPFAKSQLDFAIQFLQTLLKNGPIPSTQLLREARSLGIAPRTLARARFHLNIQCTRDHTSSRWLTHLPGPPPDYAI
jgi:hypothetical protein